MSVTLQWSLNWGLLRVTAEVETERVKKKKSKKEKIGCKIAAIIIRTDSF